MGDESLTRSHNESILNSLIEGDLVEFPRGFFSHWAVYLGNGELVHLAGVDNGRSDAHISASSFSICGVMFKKAKVRKDNFWKVAKSSMARINHTPDVMWRPRSPEEIVNIASAKIGEVGYNVLFSNCEHFAKFCRYGISQSDQAKKVMTPVAGIATCMNITGFVLAFTITAVTAAAEYVSMKVSRIIRETFCQEIKSTIRIAKQITSVC